MTSTAAPTWQHRDVLDGDHRLVSEDAQERDLLVRERANLATQVSLVTPIAPMGLSPRSIGTTTLLWYPPIRATWRRGSDMSGSLSMSGLWTTVRSRIDLAPMVSASSGTG